jgi:hypothetical protein
MSFKVTQLVVSKRLTTGDEKNGWIRKGYELEVSIQDERDLEQARAAAECLVDGWLSESTHTISKFPSDEQRSSNVGIKSLGETKTPAKDLTKLPYNIDAVPWQYRQNEKGPYQFCSDESNPDFKALRDFLIQHAGGKVSTKDSQGVFWFVWAFTDEKTLGRKKSQFVRRK